MQFEAVQSVSPVVVASLPLSWQILASALESSVSEGANGDHDALRLEKDVAVAPAGLNSNAKCEVWLGALMSGGSQAEGSSLLRPSLAGGRQAEDVRHARAHTAEK